MLKASLTAFDPTRTSGAAETAPGIGLPHANMTHGRGSPFDGVWMSVQRIKRREFIAALGGAAAAWPLAARAQQSERVRRIGILMGFAENDEVWQAYLASFRRSLKDLGWVEGRNIRFDYRFAGDNSERTRAAAEELVALAPDVIFVSTNPALSAVMEATSAIPIVFTWCPILSAAVTSQAWRIRAGT
jgi:ABC-type uncharacterized transport system substrate-binding protein